MVFLDCGHGGLNKNGGYTTAPSKMFRHSRGDFHGGGVFYEGVFNRQLTRQVASKLNMLGIPFLYVSHKSADYSLQYRANAANFYHQYHQNNILISNHANASRSHLARGFEVYSSSGHTQADVLAEMLWKQIVKLLSGYDVRMRSDLSDGDHDKEERFYILQKTLMPAILVENLFFDNYDDARLLMNPIIQDLLAEAQVRAVVQYLSQ